MSRLGKIPIKLPNGTSAKVADNFIIVNGPKGELKQALSKLVKVEISGDEIKLSVSNKEAKKEKAFWGLYWSLINNMVTGVVSGYEKKLEMIGVGYRVNLSGNNVGFSHPVEFVLPPGITGQVEGNIITVSGIDKQLVGETAAQIRKIKKPEPYKGKGIRYVDEIVRRKVGKAAGKGE